LIGIYVRISDDEQSKYSISDQLQECKKKANSNEVLEYIDEGVTGAVLDRPALSKLRDDVKSGMIDKVICWDPDRFSRDLMIQLLVANELEKRAVLEFVNHDYKKTPEGILFFQMRGAFSQFEKAKITERTTRGRKEKARQGKIVKNSFLYGYDYNKDQGTYVINEDEERIVRLIFDLFTKPDTTVKGINGIAVYLTQSGVPTKRGANIWHRQVVRQMLMNEAYTGRYTQNRYNTEGMVGNKYVPLEDRVATKIRPSEEWIETTIPAIITEAQFERAQMLISESKRRFAKDSLRKYLLSGLVRCGECGNTMTGLRAKNWTKYRLEYSDAKNYSGAKFRGCGMRVACEELDEEVWNTVLAWLNEPDQIAASMEEVEGPAELSYEEAEIERLTKEMDKTKSRRKNLIKLFADEMDNDSQEVIKDELRKLTEHEKDLKELIHLNEERQNTRKGNDYSKQIMSEAIQYYLNREAKEWTFEEQQQLIRMVVKEVRVFKDRVDIYGF
jgi:site-specific DNA recombinase